MRCVRLLTLNLRHGGKTGSGNAWQKILREYEPDIVFAQETFHPSQYLPEIEFGRVQSRLWSPVPNRKWGSAILAPHLKLEPDPIPGYEGWVVGARVDMPKAGGGAESLILVSIHAPSPGPYEPAVNAILDKVVERYRGATLILAGDFNVTTARRLSSEGLKNTPGEIKILERLDRELGLTNAWRAFHPTEKLPQTLRWTRDPTAPYHCDGIFLGEHHLQRIQDAHVGSGDEWGELSDHRPIVVTLR